MAVIGGFRSDLSITRKTDGKFGNVPQVFCFSKSRINENGGNLPRHCGHNSRVFVQHVNKIHWTTKCCLLF